MFDGGRRSSGQRNSNSRNNWNKSQELEFYQHGTGPDQQMVTFTRLKEHPILNIQGEFLNGSDIVESICKGFILYLSKLILIEII